MGIADRSISSRKNLPRLKMQLLVCTLGSACWRGLATEFINDWRLGTAYLQLCLLMAKNKDAKRAKQFAILAYMVFEL